MNLIILLFSAYLSPTVSLPDAAPEPEVLASEALPMPSPEHQMRYAGLEKLLAELDDETL